jgi:hypothetical protein
MHSELTTSHVTLDFAPESETGSTEQLDNLLQQSLSDAGHDLTHVTVAVPETEAVSTEHPLAVAPDAEINSAAELQLPPVDESPTETALHTPEPLDDTPVQNLDYHTEVTGDAEPLLESVEEPSPATAAAESAAPAESAVPGVGGTIASVDDTLLLTRKALEFLGDYERTIGVDDLHERVSATHLVAATLNEESPDAQNAAAPAAVVNGALTPEVLEAVVTRIVERMQPKVLEVLTREILRPVVEALVQRELSKY